MTKTKHALGLEPEEQQYLLGGSNSPHSPSEGRTHKAIFQQQELTTDAAEGHTNYQSLFAPSAPTSISTQPLEDSKRLSWEQYGRRTLYGSLPFVAAFGMTKKETEMKKVLSAVSINSLLEQEAGAPGSGKLLEEVDVDEITMTFHLFMAVIVAIISQFLVGYNTSVMNGAASVVFHSSGDNGTTGEDLQSTLLWSLAVSAFAIGGPGGSIVGGYLANTRGRRGAMIINNYAFLLGGLGLVFCPNIYWLIAARFVIGFASGIAMVVVPVYLGEIAPPTLRGMLGTCTQFAIVIGILASNLAAFPLATVHNWRYLFAISPLLSFLQLIASRYLVESPRWLLNRDTRSAEARVAIKRLRAYRRSSDVELEVQNYLFASAQHKTARHSAHSSGAIWDLIMARDVRILLVSSIVLQVAQQLSGINAVFYYSTAFFEGVIDNPRLGTTLIGVVNLIATIAALKLMDNTARRTLLLLSGSGMIVAMLCIIAALKGFIPSYLSLVALMVFVCSFAIGLGPIPWLIVAEMFNSKYVATAMSLACIVNWLCNFLVGLSFPFFQTFLGPYCFVPFLVVLSVSMLFIYFYLPETHGRSVEEVYKFVTTNQNRKLLDDRSCRSSSIDAFEENVVDMPVIQAVEMLEQYGHDFDI